MLRFTHFILVLSNFHLVVVYFDLKVKYKEEEVVIVIVREEEVQRDEGKL